MKRYICLILLLVFPITFYSQETKNSDELFSMARNKAFEEKDYSASIILAKQALELSPDYVDISVFLGRIYTWKDEIEEARKVFESLDERNVQDEDFFMAYASLEYWNDQPEKALFILNKGLTNHSKSEDLLLLKAKVSSGSNAYEEAEDTLTALLNINPQNAEARALLARIKELTAKNSIGITYNFSHFDKQFDDNWHIATVSYKRTTPLGSVILKGNFANKFNENGTQIELEAYPSISKTFYLYAGVGYSDDVGIFSKYRSGVSLYANLPRSFEGEVGFRYLYFSSDIWMYTASIGKYYKDFWFNLRTYITPSNENISHSYTGTVRYYTKGANDYFAFQIGTGISPEEVINNLLINDTYKLKTYKIGADYNFTINKTNAFSVSATYYNQEFKPNQKGSQYDFSIGYSKTF